MASDQQFCLRWNNHQSTLTSIFDLLLEEESLLDCTLAAEGQSLQAHRILLSACSPYFQSLLNQHAKKEPIIVLKDVTFKELQALMDYMYKGEVNVSQDELGELLKVAESLQIKGLSDSGGKSTEDKPPAQQRLAPPPPPVQQAPTVPRSGLSIEHRRSNYHSNSDLRNDSPSALDESSLPRKRKRTRRRSSEDESGLVHGQPPSEPLQELESLSLPSSLVIKPSITHAPSQPAPSNSTVIPETIAAHDRPPDHILPEPSALPLQPTKTEPGLIQPKQENEDQNDEDIEDLTMDDDYMDDSQPGPSHGSEGSTSNQGYPQWQMGADGSFDEDLLRAQAAAGGSRDSQDLNGGALTITRVKSLVPNDDSAAPTAGGVAKNDVAPTQEVVGKKDVAPNQDVAAMNDAAVNPEDGAIKNEAPNQDVVAKKDATSNRDVVAKKDAAPNRDVVAKKDAAPNQDDVAMKVAAANQDVVAKKDELPNKDVVAKKDATPNQDVVAKKDATPNRDVVAKKDASLSFKCPCCGTKSSKCWVCGSTTERERRRKSVRPRSPDVSSRPPSRSSVSSRTSVAHKPKTCYVCGKDFKLLSSSQIDQHRRNCAREAKEKKERKHKSKEKHSCMCCDFVGDNQWMLRSHMRNIHLMEVLDQA